MKGEGQIKSVEKLKPERGKILDRNLEILAFNVPAVDVVAYPEQVNHNHAVAQRLSSLIHKSPGVILQALEQNDNFVYLARNLPSELEARIKALNITGIRCQKTWKRKYPKATLASNMLGFLNVDGIGLSGLELALDQMLAGAPGEVVLLRTATSKRIYYSEYPQKLPEDGHDVVLTIDSHYQYVAEKELYKTVVQSGAESGVVIIMNPQNAEILAMACVPNFNPNAAGEYHPSTWRLRPITDQYEPGSTMKVVMMSMLLNEGLRSPNDMIFCEHGKLKLRDREIHDSEPHDWLSLRDVLVLSSNIGMAKTMREVNRELIFNYLNAFGFGVKTGIELVGEVNGIMKPFYTWEANTPTALAIGHEISVNALQMACAFCTMANGGYLIRPTVIKEIHNKNKKIINRDMRVIRRVIKKAAADTLKDIMCEVVTRGTAKKANLTGIKACGKTGTARILREDGKGFEKDKHIASFGGFFPMENPKLCIFVVLRNPQGDYYGGETAAPLFKRISEQIIQKEGLDYFLADDRHRSEIAAFERKQRRVPSLVGLNKHVAVKVAHKEDLNISSVGDGSIVLSQQPQVDTILKEDEKIIITTERKVKAGEGIIVPQVIGLPLRRAMNLLAAKKIRAVVDGSGRVVRQQPPPGQRVRPDEQVLLHCESAIDVGKLLAL